MSKLLESKDLERLTGYKSNVKIASTLTRQGIGFVSDKDGNIKTTWQAVNAVLIGNKSAALPDFSALDR